MKIKLTRGTVVNKQPYAKGDEVEVADRDGQQLISSGRAVKVLQLAKAEESPEPKRSTRKKSLKSR